MTDPIGVDVHVMEGHRRLVSSDGRRWYGRVKSLELVGQQDPKEGAIADRDTDARLVRPD